MTDSARTICTTCAKAIEPFGVRKRIYVTAISKPDTIYKLFAVPGCKQCGGVGWVWSNCVIEEGAEWCLGCEVCEVEDVMAALINLPAI